MGHIYRRHVNDLDALLKATAAGRYVVVTVFSKRYRAFAANWQYTIERFGRVRSMVVVAMGDEGLQECLTLGFPCYNGTLMSATSVAAPGATFAHGHGDYNRLMWAKPMIIQEVLKRRYSVLFSDMDTVWFKDALRSFAVAADRHDADVVGMNDDWNGFPNAGNLFLRESPRTLALVDAWLSIGFDARTREFTANASVFHDQDGLRTLNNTRWLACGNSSSCLSVQTTGMAAVWLHPWHGCPWGEVFNASQGGACSDSLAYLHIFCTAGGPGVKSKMAKGLGLWFVRSGVIHPLWDGARAVDLINQTHSHPNIDNLPCANDIAWVTGEIAPPPPRV